MPQFIPNLGVRMVEATLRAAGLADLDLRLWDFEAKDLPRVTAEVMDFDPDVAGFSAFLWSLPDFLRLAGMLKREDPSRLVVFGGPSARPIMLDHPACRDAAGFVDLLVINEGEHSFAEIVALDRRDEDSLGRIKGIALRGHAGWHETPARPLGDLNDLPSPYVMGLMEPRGLGVLQTYRGCPFTCSFCEWGVLESPKRVCAEDKLAAEFDAMAGLGLQGILLADAGLNLNASAFQMLRAASERTGFFIERGLICEVYPATVRDEHLDFLRGVGSAHVGVGLQSFDNNVLANVERRYDERRFEATLAALGEVAQIAIEMILGLPGDTPDGFRRNFERARRLPCALRLYHCVVLPSGLMARSPPEHQVKYDGATLKMQSCFGWSEAALQREVAFLDAEVERAGGTQGEFFWVFPPP